MNPEPHDYLLHNGVVLKGLHQYRKKIIMDQRKKTTLLYINSVFLEDDDFWKQEKAITTLKAFIFHTISNLSLTAL